MSWQDKLSFKLRELNAYEYNGPLTNRELFIDREEELEEAFLVCKRIVKGSIGGVFVLGGRASGKTTFLEKLQDILNENKIPTVFIPLNRGMVEKENAPLFFKTMVDRSIIALKDADLIGLGLKDKLINFLRGFAELEAGFEASGLKFLAKWKRENVEEQFPYFILKDAMDDLLRIIENQENNVDNKGIIFLFDEGNAFVTNKDLLEVIRNVFQFTPKLGLVIAGTLNMLNDVSVVFSPMARFFRKIELGPYHRDEDVHEAINRPFDFMSKKLMHDGIMLRSNLGGFSTRLIEVTRKMPMDINLLCHFAYEEASRRFLKQGNVVSLRYLLDKKVLDRAMNELRGTKDYSEFIGSLSDFEIGFLRILANSVYPLNANELGHLVFCNKLGENLQELDMENLCTLVENEKDLGPVSEATILDIIEKGNKCNLETISKNIIGKPAYVMNDQWLGSYFKIVWAQRMLDIDKGFVPIFGGIFMFHDPIASMLHSTIFPRISSYMKDARPFKVLSHRGTSQSFRKPRTSERTYLSIDYQRNADDSNYFYILNMSRNPEIETIRKNTAKLMSTLRSKGLVNKYNVTIIE